MFKPINADTFIPDYHVDFPYIISINTCNRDFYQKGFWYFDFEKYQGNRMTNDEQLSIFTLYYITYNIVITIICIL